MNAERKSLRLTHLVAVALATAGFTCFVLVDSLIKLCGSSLPGYEVVGGSGLVMAFLLAVYAAWRTSWRDVLPARPGRLLLRSLLDLGNTLFVVVALRHLSLTLFYILVFLSPLVVSVMSHVVLKELLDWRRAAAVLTGFVGVLLAVYPLRSGSRSAWAGVAACGVCVLCFSASIVWARVIAQAERPEAIAFLSGLVSAAAGLVGLCVHAAPVSRGQFAALVLMGLLGAVGSVCVFTALRQTAAGTVSQYHYTQLVSGAAISYFAFHEVPSAWMAAGAVLIVGSGVYVALWVPGEARHRVGLTA